jgi:hypothetical protein
MPVSWLKNKNQKKETKSMSAPGENQLYPKIKAISVFCLLLVSLIGLTASAEWPQFQVDTNNTGYLETGGITGSVGHEAAVCQTTSSPEYDPFVGIAADEDRVYCSASNGFALAFYRNNLSEVWGSAASISESYAAPVSKGNYIYTAGGLTSTVSKIRKSDGEKVESNSSLISGAGSLQTVFGLTEKDGVLFMGDWDGNGDSHQGLVSIYTENLTLKNKYGGGQVKSTPVVTDDKVVVTEYSGDIVAYSRSDQSVVWGPKAIGGGSANSRISPTVYEGKVIAFNNGGEVSVFDLQTGSEIWSDTSILSGNIAGSPAVHNESIFIGDYDENFYRINLTNGNSQQTSINGLVSGSPAVANNLVYVSTTGGNFYALDSSTLNEAWHYTGLGSQQYTFYSGVSVIDNQVFFGSGKTWEVVKLNGDGADASAPEVKQKNLVDRTDFNGILKEDEKVSVYANITDDSGVASATADLSQFGAGSSVTLENETSAGFDWDGDGTLEGDIYGANATVDGSSTTDGTSKSATITATDDSSMSNTMTTSEFGSLTVDTSKPVYRKLNVTYVATRDPIFRANFSENTSGLDAADTEVEVSDSSRSLFEDVVYYLSDIFVQGKDLIIFDFSQRSESLDEGKVEVNITAEDIAGNRAKPHTENFTVDVTKPYNFSLNPGNEVFKQSSDNFTLEYSYNELNPNYTEISIRDDKSNINASVKISESGENPDGSYEFDLDNSSYSLTSDETYDVEVFAEDLAGNTNSTTAQDLLTIDDTPPVLNQSVKVSDTEFEFKVSDNQALNSSSVEETDLEYKTPGVSGAFSLGSCPTHALNCTVSATLDREVDIYTVKAGIVPGEDVRDAAGNIQTDDNVTIKGMDGVPPEIRDTNLSDATDDNSIVTGGDKVKVFANVTDGVKVESVTANLTEFGLGDVVLESEASAGKDWNGDGQKISDYYGINATVSDSAPDGTGKSSWVTASDNSSNTNTSLEFGSLEIDNTPPQVEITDPENASPVYLQLDESLDVNFTYTEENPEYANITIGPSTKLFNSLSSGSSIDVQKTFSSGELPGEGVYNLNLTMNDSVSQEGEDGELNTVFIDDTPPGNVSNLRHEDATANSGYDDDQEVDFNWTAAEDEISGVDHYRVFNSTDGGTTYSDASVVQDTNFTVPAVNGDEVVLKVLAVDRAGNVGDNKTSNTITVDTQPPQVNIYTPLSGDDIVNKEEQDSFRVNGTIENDLSGQITVNVSDGVSEVSNQSVEFSEGNFSVRIDISALSDGSIDVEATATDEAGNTGDTTTEQATKDTVAPDFSDAYKVNKTRINATLNDSGVGLKPSSIEATDFGLDVGAVSEIDASAVSWGETEENVTIDLAEKVDSDAVTVSIEGKIQDRGENNLTSGSQTVTGMDAVPPDFSQKNLTDATDGNGKVSQGDKVTVSAQVTDGETVSLVEANMTELGAGSSVSMSSEQDASYDWDNDSSYESDVYGANVTVGSESSPGGEEANATVTAEDESGNSNTSAEFGQLLLDDNPPEINSIDQPTNESPAYISTDEDFQIEFNYTEENPDTVNFTVGGRSQLNDSFTGGENLTATRTFLHQNTPTQDGFYNLTVTMNDTSGLEGSLTEWKPVVVDETDPSSVSELQHYDETANSGYDDDGNVTFNWSDATDETSGVKNYSIEISRDGDSTYEDSTVIPGSQTEYNVSATGGDNVSVKVQAVDYAGNTGPETESNHIKVDETPPEANIYDPLAGDNIVNSAEDDSLKVNGTISNDDSGIYDLRVNDSSSTVSKTDLSFSNGNFSTRIDVSSLSDGEITVRVTPTDEAGNKGDTEKKSLTKDSVPPDFSDAYKENLTAINATFEDATTGLNASSITASDFTLDVGAIESIESSWISDGDEKGNVTIYLQEKVDSDQVKVSIAGEIKDLANNNLTSGSQTVSGMDGVPPKITEKNLSDITNHDGVVIEGERVQVVAKVTDGDYVSRVDTNLTEFGAGDQVTMISENVAGYDWDGDGDEGLNVYGTNATVGSSTDVTGGLKNATVTGEDGSGNINVSEPFGEIKIDNNPPEITGFNTSAVSDSDASGEDLLVYFNSSQQLSEINVSVEDPVGVYSYLAEAAFSEQTITEGYNYTAVFDAEKTGVFNATLLTAEDVNGLNGSDLESSESSLDNENPQVEEIETLDRDEDGSVDAANVTFNKAIDDSTVVADDWQISGTAADSFDTGTDVDDNRIQLRLNDGNEISGTDVKNVTYTKDEPEDPDIEGLNGNELVEVGTSFKETDAARPLAAVSVSEDPLNEKDLSQDVTVTYTESMNQSETPEIEFTGTEGVWTNESSGWSASEEFSATYSVTDEDEDKTATVSVTSANDTSGNMQFDNSTSFEVDTIVPNASTVLNGSQIFNGTSVNVTKYFNYSTGDGESAFYDYTGPGGSGVISAPESWDSTQVEDGEYTFYMTVEDDDGNTNQTSGDAKVDNSPPSDLSIDYPEFEVYRNSSDTLTVEYSYTEANPNTTELRLVDQSANVDALVETEETSADPDTQVTIDLDSGEHSITGETYDINLTAIDDASRNSSISSPDKLTIDNGAPVLKNPQINSPTELSFDVVDQVSGINATSLEPTDFEIEKFSDTDNSASFTVKNCIDGDTRCNVTVEFDSRTNFDTLYVDTPEFGGFKDLAGNLNASAQLEFTGTDTLPPGVESLDLNVSRPVSEDDKGDVINTLVKFNESMNTSKAPEVTVEGLDSTFDVTGSFENSTHWNGSFLFDTDKDYEDDEVDGPFGIEDGVEAEVVFTGAEDSSGNSMPEAADSAGFGVDTLSPIVDLSSMTGEAFSGTVDLTSYTSIDYDDGGTTHYSYSTDGGATWNQISTPGTWDSTVVGDGSVDVEVNDTDEATNYNFDQTSVVVDNTKPEVEVNRTEILDGDPEVLEDGEEFRLIVNGSDGTSGISRVEVNVSEVTTLDGFTRIYDDDNDGNYTQNFTMNVTAFKTNYKPPIKIYDAAGNVRESATSPVNVTSDPINITSEAIETVIETDENGNGIADIGDTLEIRWNSSSDKVSDVQSVEANFSAVGGPAEKSMEDMDGDEIYTAEYTLESGSFDGSFSGNVSATDDLSRTDTEKSSTSVQVDNDRPEAPRDRDAKHETNGRINVIWNPPPAEDVDRYIVYRRPKPSGDYSSIGEFTGTRVVEGPFQHGEHYGYKIQAVDDAGNKGANTSEVALRADTRPPEIRSARVRNLDGTNSVAKGGEVNVSIFTVDNPSLVDQVEVNLSELGLGSDVELTSRPQNRYWDVFEISSSVETGELNVSYNVTDNAGHYNTTSASIFVDTTRPWIEINEQENQWFTEKPKLDIDFLDNIGIGKVRYRLGSQENYTLLNDSVNGNLTREWELGIWENASEGENLLYFNVTDEGGIYVNTSNDSEAFSFRKDTADPGTRDNHTSGWNSTNRTVKINETDATSGILETEYCLGEGCTPDQEYTEPLNFTGTGVSVLRYNSTDVAGNTQDVQTTEVKIDRTPPELANASIEVVSGGDQVLDQGEEFLVSANVTDKTSFIPEDEVQVDLSQLDMGTRNLSASNSSVFNETFELDQQGYSIEDFTPTVTASDAAGNENSTSPEEGIEVDTVQETDDGGSGGSGGSGGGGGGGGIGGIIDDGDENESENGTEGEPGQLDPGNQSFELSVTPESKDITLEKGAKEVFRPEVEVTAEKQVELVLHDLEQFSSYSTTETFSGTRTFEIGLDSTGVETGTYTGTLEIQAGEKVKQAQVSIQVEVRQQNSAELEVNTSREEIGYTYMFEEPVSSTSANLETKVYNATGGEIASRQRQVTVSGEEFKDTIRIDAEPGTYTIETRLETSRSTFSGSEEFAFEGGEGFPTPLILSVLAAVILSGLALAVYEYRNRRKVQPETQHMFNQKQRQPVKVKDTGTRTEKRRQSRKAQERQETSRASEQSGEQSIHETEIKDYPDEELLEEAEEAREKAGEGDFEEVEEKLREMENSEILSNVRDVDDASGKLSKIREKIEEAFKT